MNLFAGLPPHLRRYHCIKCKIVHTGGCKNTKIPEDGDERQPGRECLDCRLSTKPTKDTKKRAADSFGDFLDGVDFTTPGLKKPKLPASPSKSGDLMVMCRCVRRGGHFGFALPAVPLLLLQQQQWRPPNCCTLYHGHFSSPSFLLPVIATIHSNTSCLSPKATPSTIVV